MTPLWQREPVGVVGLGLIGGSLGLDLMAMGAQVRALVHRQATAERAAQRGLATEVSTDPVVLAGCGLVVLALPLDRLLDPDPALVAALPAGAVITDVGSVKAPVLRRWWELLAAAGDGPAPCRFVASHPMAGTARAGVEAGEPGLFRGRPWVATPEAGTDPAALEAVRELAEALGARWLCCDAEAHDRAVALISHLPVLVGAALLQAANAGGGAEAGAALVRALASSGFADTTRVGGGNPELGMLMARANRAALLEALGHYRHSLACLEAMVAGEQWSDLQQSLELSHQLRPDFL
ncbi:MULTISPECIES: prephenate/arogenate dehydrogenase [unclassified Cyanobium]|uniref:prephenate/arogenate dehydrogenase n=1 Tax=unclassified Cyanobium TaxID=2627006 RepID=UPI0020CBA195|nr:MULTISPECIES: prephenate/arogenate dehydrogenase [unclassified Cyanobium]MCP9834836.1 prephenate/arogenate dehydrogenase [Cyanobium sp. La Preciosa 7G6]MCP9937540.1 prephenate/arogenate dehydrogenase [Cyanobium sp. Aljojuca 7A6]